MTGHIFHQNRDELHGVTVVLSGKSGKTYLGRWHERGPRGVTLRNVAIHDPDHDATDLVAWLARQEKFGVAATEQHLIVPADEAGDVRVFAG
ncbi:MAG TPA: hypothetical protein VGM77_05015 [Gemmatimonadales bacterium]|jgi:hypothetical protein